MKEVEIRCGINSCTGKLVQLFYIYMNKILIGSTAIKYWFPEFPRDPKDLDYAVDDEYKGDRAVEYLYNPVLFKHENHLDVTMFANESILGPDAIYTLKISHMFWDINWNKHIFDIQWLKDRGCKVIEPLFYDLYEFFKELHGGNKRSDLAMNAESFFNNAISCEHDHDYLHTLLVNPPTYTKILKDGAEVEVDVSKFNNLSFKEKCSLVREEVYVMSWERVPKWDYRKGYEMMLKKFIMGHAPMWEALFILDNFKSLYKPEFNYYKTIEDAIRIKNNK